MTVSMLQKSQKVVEMSVTHCIDFDHVYHKMTDKRLPFPNIVLILKLLEGSKFT